MYKPLLVSLLLLGSLPFAVQASTFTVGSLNDIVDSTPGDGICRSTAKDGCTLRAAIMEANAYAGTDTIRISSAGTYALTLTGTDNAAAVGDLDITEKVNIYGVSGVTIDAASLGDRIFDIRGAYAVKLRDVTLTHGGGSTTTTGGGIYSNGATLTIRDVTIQNSSATDGGGLYIDGGTVSVDVSHNMSFTSNTATSNGGAIYNNGGTFSTDVRFSPLVTGSADFTSNSAADMGGAIYAELSTATTFLINATFTSNSALIAGAIRNHDSTLTVKSSDFENNISTVITGGAIYNGNGDSANPASMAIDSSTFTGNSAHSGGAITDIGGTTTTISNCVFANNAASEGGGAIYGAYPGTVLNITDSIFEYNDVSAGQGGGIDIGLSAVLNVSNSLFYNNTAYTNGGAIAADQQYFSTEFYLSVVTITNSTFSENAARYYGGGIYSENLDLILNNVTLYNNTTMWYDGGGIYSASILGTQTFRNTIIAGNTAGRSGNDCYALSSYPLTSNDYNLVGSTDNCAFTVQSHDRTGTTASPKDPGLLALADNDGDGELDTHAFSSATSEPINHGNPAGCTDGTSTLTTDQRGTGYSRTVSSACDIGAYEQQ